MIRRRTHPQSSVSTRRVEAYTDGVFAIAATLLVLDLTSIDFGTVTTDAELWTAIVGISHPLFTFVISFAILSLMWMTHVGQFEHIARIDNVGIWLNNARLLFIVFVPFASSLMTDFYGLLLGRTVLPATFFLAIVCSWAQWLWAQRDRASAMPSLTDDEARAQGRGSLSAVLIAAGVLAASPFIGSFAFFLFALDGLLTRALGGKRGPVDPA